MIVYDPMSQISVVVQNTPPDTTDVLTWPPSVLGDPLAAASQLADADSAASFMQTQWRMAASNMLGIGAVASGWA